jgi:PBP1b-binding outer membrane lipoprotein LpoB
MKKLKIPVPYVSSVVCVLILLAVSGCSMITPEQTQQAKDAINKQITPENVEKIKEILK